VEAPTVTCDRPTPGEAPLRRLTAFEYDNSVRDILGDDSRPSAGFAAEAVVHGFSNQTLSQGISELIAQQYIDAAEAIAARAVEQMDFLLDGCNLARRGQDACARVIIARFGRRFFRRPLRQVEKDRLEALYLADAESPYPTRIGSILQAMLLSPHFLYRAEFGEEEAAEDGVVPLNDYEVATRLSYLLWSSTPDDVLLAQAEAGRLSTAEEVAAQARRMLEDDRAREAVGQFHAQWLGLDGLQDLVKDPAVYPEYSDRLRGLWHTETTAFVEHVIFDGQGDLATLLTAPYTMANDTLAAFYGIEAHLGASFEKVELDPNRASGILTQGGLLARLSNANRTSPVHRGQFVREKLLCGYLPPPPPNLEIVAPEPDPNTTVRAQFEEIGRNPDCAGCHILMNPIGFGFENFDGVGRWRDSENGLPIDASGEVVATEIGDFDGPVELGAGLADSPAVRDCMVSQWFRYGHGRLATSEDQCAVDSVTEAFETADGDLQTLLVALTQTDAFRFRKTLVPSASTGGAQ